MLVCSGMAGVVTAMSMMLVLLAATRPFQIMPLNALAAIVIAGVIPLVDFGSLLPLLKVMAKISIHTPERACLLQMCAMTKMA